MPVRADGRAPRRSTSVPYSEAEASSAAAAGASSPSAPSTGLGRDLALARFETAGHGDHRDEVFRRRS